MEKKLQSLTLQPVEEDQCPAQTTLSVDTTHSKKVTDLEPEAVFKCQVCDAAYQKYGRLVNHLREKHEIIAEDNLFKCDKCDKFFDSVKKLNRHKKSHNKK